MNTALLDLLVKHISHRIRDAERDAIVEVANWYDLEDRDLAQLHDAVWKEIRKN